ncbi:unnamed protein product [Polarella glacialis]|uniref:Uncharacterized protein n=1 Tax=Polarella glacialis TaxID=89957 RepID=A0A813FTI3_POLGL|nr:unnamed protein product [Polarella glacialis]
MALLEEAAEVGCLEALGCAACCGCCCGGGGGEEAAELGCCTLALECLGLAECCSMCCRCCCGKRVQPQAAPGGYYQPLPAPQQAVMGGWGGPQQVAYQGGGGYGGQAPNGYGGPPGYAPGAYYYPPPQQNQGSSGQSSLLEAGLMGAAAGFFVESVL